MFWGREGEGFSELVISRNWKNVKNYHELQKVNFRPVCLMGISAKNSRQNLADSKQIQNALTFWLSSAAVSGGGSTGLKGVRRGKVMRGRCWASVTTLLLTTVFMVTSGLWESGGQSSSSLERRERLSRCGNVCYCISLRAWFDFWRQ